MNTKACTCKQCGNDHLYYQMPTNFIFKAIAIQIYWCQKCESKNYIWGWDFKKAY